MMVHTCNYITQKAEAGGLLHTGSQAKLQNETISKKKSLPMDFSQFPSAILSI